MSIIPAKPGFIYIMRCQQFFKVGHAKDPKGRLVDMQIGNPFLVKLIKTLRTRDMGVAEQYIHRELAVYRERGEWFLLPGDVLEWLLSLDLDSYIPESVIAPLVIDESVTEQVRELVQQGHGKKAIIKALWGIQSGGGKFYQQASEVLDSILPTVPHKAPSIDRSLLDGNELSGLYPDEAARMIEHNKTAVKPSKSSTIQAGFGVSRGGSAAYARASLIYDTLFGAPAPAIKYRERTPEQEALRQQLRLGK